MGRQLLGDPLEVWDGGDAYRAPVVLRLNPGLTYRQLDYWARTGLVVPSVAAADGSGTARLWSFEDLVELRIVAGLLERGYNSRGRLGIRGALEAYRAARDRAGSALGLCLLTTGSEEWKATNIGNLIDEWINEPGTILAIVNVDGIRIELETELVSFEQEARGRVSS